MFDQERKSQFSSILEHLAEFVTEHNEKIRPYDSPKETFKILGVNNTDGIFHAYDAKGKDIKQPYKKVSAGDFAYNPYRINVGSIGWVPPKHDGAYISPAYVVFSIDETVVLPELFWFIMKSAFFNQTLRAVTAGSVRMNLTYPLLQTLKIPIPPISVQQKIIVYWEKAQNSIRESEIQYGDIKKKAFDSFRSALGLSITNYVEKPRLFVAKWSQTDRWGLDLVWQNKYDSDSFAYPIKPLKEVCKTGSGGTPNRKHKEYFSGTIPWVKTTEVRNNIINDTEEKITALGLAASSAKVYPSGSIVVAMYGQGATRGRTAKLGIEASTNQACLVITEINESLDPDFLWYYLMVSYESLRSLASGNNQPNLSAELIGKFPVPIPPTEIQNRLKKLFEKAQNELSRLQSFKDEMREYPAKELEQLILGIRPVEDI